jgi:hypothetical protein
MTTLSNYTKEQIKEAVLKHICNPKKLQKWNLATIAKNINFNEGNYFYENSDQLKRVDILNTLKSMIEKYGFDEVLKNDWNSDEILLILKKQK